MEHSAPEVTEQAAHHSTIPLPDERQGLQPLLKTYEGYVGNVHIDALPSTMTSIRRRPRWQLPLAGLLFLLLGLGIGIGVGYTIGHENGGSISGATTTASSDCPTATNTTVSPTLEPYVPVYGYESVPYTNCSASEPTYISHIDNSTFTKQCDVVYDGVRPIDTDIGQAQTYSFEACMDACRLLNSSICSMVTYTADYTAAFQVYGHNCFLKNGTGRKVSGEEFGSMLSPTIGLWASAYMAGSM